MGSGPATLDLPRQAEQLLRVADVDAFYFAVRSSNSGRLLAGDADFPPLGPSLGGAYDSQLRGEPVRMAFRTVQVGDEAFSIGVAKTMRKRLQVRSAVLRVLILLETVFTLALIGLIWFTVTGGLRPLARMRSDLKARDANDSTGYTAERRRSTTSWPVWRISCARHWLASSCSSKAWRRVMQVTRTAPMR